MKKAMAFEELKGESLFDIREGVYIDEDGGEDDGLNFYTNTGRHFLLYHEQDCCESVEIEDICGDLRDLIGEPLLLVEEVTYEPEESPRGCSIIEDDHSFSWTFYKLATQKGTVTIRWYGTSNGYYSEAVDFCEVVSSKEKKKYEIY